MADIKNRKDLETLITLFYHRALLDGKIGFIFTDVAKINLEKHIPIICDFWEAILFQKNTYKKNAIKIHQDLNDQVKLTAEHFESWLSLFNTCVDECFVGNNAETIKIRARSIATVMQVKLAANRK
ncbi:MAG TPA: group III truncated hemoglobin [Fulvivirga sp.]|nr:group III truncated hemoglobin [Fulvivirga sp.]